MKKAFLFLLIFILFSPAYSQWVSPNVGNDFTFNELFFASGGAVEKIDDHTFRVVQDITIAPADGLSIDIDEQYIYVDDAVTITIQGSFDCVQHETGIVMQADPGQHFNLNFESNSTGTLSGIEFIRGAGFSLVECEVTFENCSFHDFNMQSQSGALDCFNASPVISHCSFFNNEGPAILTAGNGSSSPQILYCDLRNNVTSNSNMAQINLGPSVNDSIRIIGCSIIGGRYNLSGGIGILDLTMSGTTKARISDNYIADNRYGYMHQGFYFDVLLTDNVIECNNAAASPLNGGGGIAIYGVDDACKATLRRNIVRNNLWGVLAAFSHPCHIDMGTEDDWGYNCVYDNVNTMYGMEELAYGFYNNGPSDHTAIGNYWGSNDPVVAESMIWDQTDMGIDFGRVSYLPILQLHPVITSLTLTEEANPGLCQDYFGEINYDEKTIVFNVMESSLPAVFHADIVLPLAVSSDYHSGEPLDLSEPAIINVTTPHGESQAWTVRLVNNFDGIGEQETGLQIRYRPDSKQIVISETLSKGSVQVYNTLGQTVFSGVTGLDTYTIDASSWNRGIYIVTVSNGIQKKSHKVMVR